MASGNGHDKRSRKLLGIGWEEISKPPHSDWLIKQVLARGAVSAFVGPPGSGKSALLLDMAVSLAIGAADWRGYRIKRSAGVIILALERDFLMRQRIAAYKLRDELPTRAPLRVYNQLITPMDPNFPAIMADTIAQFEDDYGIGVGLVIIDTHAKALAAGGGDEMNPKDQNIAANNVRRVVERHWLHVTSSGHTGKEPSRGERGTNARQADLDMENIIEVDGGLRIARVTKANYRALGDLTAFSLEPVELGLDEDGDMETTALVSPVLHGAPKKTREPSGKAKSPAAELRDEFVRHMPVAIDDHGEERRGHDGKPVRAVLFSFVNDKIRQFGYFPETADEAEKAAQRAALSAARRTLLNKRIIYGDKKGFIWKA